MTIKELFQPDSKAFSALIVGASLIVSVFVIGMFAFSIRGLDYTMSATGSARQSVSADTAKWVIAVTRTVPVYGLSSGYAQIAKDLDLTQKFLASEKFSESEITISAVSMEQYYGYGSDQKSASEREYVLRQTVTINSSDVAKVTSASKKMGNLVGQGVLASIQSLEYTISNLNKMRISMLESATKDARARVEKIAKSGGRKIGELRSAASGVVQVLPKGSLEISDYGSYDTSSIEKEVMVTVRATFSLD
jgi:hypothetical protein